MATRAVPQSSVVVTYVEVKLGIRRRARGHGIKTWAEASIETNTAVTFITADIRRCDHFFFLKSHRIFS